MKCSIRNAPTGTIPLSECKRRSRNERPSPARSGLTPIHCCGSVSARGDAAVAILSRDSFDDSEVVKQTPHYLVHVRGESNESTDYLDEAAARSARFLPNNSVDLSCI